MTAGTLPQRGPATAPHGFPARNIASPGAAATRSGEDESRTARLSGPFGQPCPAARPCPSRLLIPYAGRHLTSVTLAAGLGRPHPGGVKAAPWPPDRACRPHGGHTERRGGARLGRRHRRRKRRGPVRRARSARAGHEATVLERDDLQPAPDVESAAGKAFHASAPQIVQPHLIIARCRQLLIDRLPDVYDGMLEPGVEEPRCRPRCRRRCRTPHPGRETSRSPR